MCEVAGVLVHDAQRTPHTVPPRPRDLGRIAHTRAEGATARRPRRIFLEHVAVGLQVRSAAGRVHDDGQLAARARVDVGSRQLSRLLTVAGVGVKRAATELLDRRGDAMPVALEYAHRRALRVTEGLTHHAAGEYVHVGVSALGELERCALGARRESAEPCEATRTDAPRE